MITLKIYKILLFFVILFYQIEAQSININEPISYIALGDSYTIGQSVSENERWPNILLDTLRNRGVKIFISSIRAQTGWTTSNLISSLETNPISFSPNLVSLLIGVNNQFQGRSLQEYEQEFENLIQKALNYVNNDTSSIFVLSIPDYAYTPFGGGNNNISKAIDTFNRTNKLISHKYGITYIDITDISRLGLDRPELVATDGLHPSGIQYAEWVDRILPYINLPNLDIQIDMHLKYDINVFPNPFNSMVTISFNLKRDDNVKINIFNINGETIRNLHHDYISKGIHQITWDGKDDFGRTMSTGIYLLYILTNDNYLTKKILLVK